MNMTQPQLEEQMKIQQQVAQLETMAKQFLAPDAIARYGNIKSAHPQRALQISALIAQLGQQGKLPNRLSDAEFKELLLQLEPAKREVSIKRI